MKPIFEALSPEEGAAVARGIAADPDNPEWTEADVAAAQPAMARLPEVVAAFRRTRGKQRAATKELISLRLDQDVVARLRQSGRGWQSRLNETLRRLVLTD
jgi:uncharacterized protein (DUF4415 family)